MEPRGTVHPEIGKGGVDSSILSGGTSIPTTIPKIARTVPAFAPAAAKPVVFTAA